MTTELRLPVLDAAGERMCDEVLPAVALGADRYRLLASPGLVEGVAAGDELELAAAEPCGFRVLHRSGQLCIWVYVSEPPGLRILTVPVAAGFPRIEAEINAAITELPGSSWAYGNVYDSQHRPMGWWERSR